MKIEDFRYNRLGQDLIAVLLKENNSKIYFQTNYIVYAQATVDSMIECMNNCENPIIDTMFDNNSAITAFSSIFLALESYINLFGRVLDCEKVLSFDEFKKKDLDARLNNLIEVFSLDKSILSKNGIYKTLNEFKSIRNELFHDRQFNKKINLLHTDFSQVPPYFNLCDTMEALRIYLSIVSTFRYAFNDIDLMPQIRVTNSNGPNFFQINKVYKTLFCYWYRKILKKHSLTSEFDATINDDEVIIDFNRDKFEIQNYIYHDSDHAHRLDTYQKTEYGKQYANNIGGLKLPSNTFRLTSYKRK